MLTVTQPCFLWLWIVDSVVISKYAATESNIIVIILAVPVSMFSHTSIWTHVHSSIIANNEIILSKWSTYTFLPIK